LVHSAKIIENFNSGILSSKSVNFGQLLQLKNMSDILKMKLQNVKMFDDM